MALSLRTGAVSDIGRSRKKNDDSGYAGTHFVMVADGMGGAAAGDLASAVAVQTMLRLDDGVADDMLEAMAGAVHRANDRLAELVDEDSSVEGMGTTVTAALFDGERVALAHLGDSRGYLWRDGKMTRITHDHTWVQSLIDEGRITEDEARVHSHRSLLLKVLDGRHENDPDLSVLDVRAGDRILICSDGLSGFVAEERIERVLSVGAADAVAHELTQIALEAGSTDNITVVVADVVDEPEAAAEPVLVGAVADHPRGPFSRLRSWAQRDELTPGEALMVDPGIDPEELRYAPREPKRFRWLKRAITLIVVLVLLGALSQLTYGWTQKQYFVAAYDGRVAIFRGVQADLPLITLHRVYEEQDLHLSQLPSFRRSQVVDGLAADNLKDARKMVQELRTFAENCAEQAATSTSPAPGSSRSAPTTRTAASSPRPGADGVGTRTGAGTKTGSGTRTGAGTKTGSGTTKPRGTAAPTRTPATTPTAGTPSTTAGERPPGEECSGSTPVVTTR